MEKNVNICKFIITLLATQKNYITLDLIIKNGTAIMEK